LLRWFWISAAEKTASSEMFIKRLFMDISEEDSGNLTINCLEAVFSAESQRNLSRVDELYSAFHVEFGMSSEFDFGDFCVAIICHCAVRRIIIIACRCRR
jgi:hypothetical protein